MLLLLFFYYTVFSELSFSYCSFSYSNGKWINYYIISLRHILSDGETVYFYLLKYLKLGKKST